MQADTHSEEAMGSKHHSPRADKISAEKSLNTTYTERPVDTVITSPPYEQVETRSNDDKRVNRLEKAIAEGKTISPRNLNWLKARKNGQNQGTCYDGEGKYNQDNANNIGNLRKETYLSAMLKVYAEMFQVLKPNGTAAIIVKPFIRNKQVVDLPYQTWLLMQKCGFQLTKLFKLRLDSQSFWRILYAKKYPLVPTINHEYILVCTKPFSAVK